jgi:DNA modification methylase
VKHPPGRVRDAIMQVLSLTSTGLSVKQIEERATKVIGLTPPSSVRSYLRLNTPGLFVREDRGVYSVGPQHPGIQVRLIGADEWEAPVTIGNATLVHADCFDWLDTHQDNSLHAVVTDPPYGLHEYSPLQQLKMRNGKGGVWRIPPAFDGHQRAPLPRFTTLTDEQRRQLRTFFFVWARLLLPKLVPGANVVVASNPLLSFIVSGALADAGLEARGTIVRQVMTLRGGDRPKGAHAEFEGVSAMPRSMWEPWVVFRKPVEGRVQDNLRKWKTGGFRRLSDGRPFGDLIQSAPTRKNERTVAPHPSLKPQMFMRQLVRGVLPLGEGVILDPFAGAGSTLAAAEFVGYRSIGIEKDSQYFQMAKGAIPRLTEFRTNGEGQT